MLQARGNPIDFLLRPTRTGTIDIPAVSVKVDGQTYRSPAGLKIEVQPIDAVSNNVSVSAKIEGRSGAGLVSEWVTVRSSGVAEDEFLAKLVEAVTGKSVEPVQDLPH